MAGFVEKRNGPLSTGKRPFTLSDGLKRLSSFGMFYDDLVLRQSQAIGPTEDAFGYGQMNPMGVDNDDIHICIYQGLRSIHHVRTHTDGCADT